MKGKKLLYVLLGVFLLRAVLAFVVWHPDLYNHVDWGVRFFEYGPGKFFAAETNVWSFTWPNQPPGTIYIFALMRKAFEGVFSFFWWLNVTIPAFPSNLMLFLETNLYPALLQLPAILADFGIAYIIYRIFKDKRKEKLGRFAALVFLLNPVIWFNSSYWGQTDAVVNFFALLAFFLLLKKKLPFAALSFAASIYIKASLLIFAPIFLVVALRQKYKAKQWVKALVLPAGVFGILTLPFSQGEPFTWLYNLFVDKVFVQQLQIITANAFNIWAAIAGIHEKSHNLILGPLSYKWWGMILYSLSYLPALYLVYKKQDAKSIFWALSIVAFSTFMLLTNMHERYLYPLFPVFTILVAFERRLLGLYAAISALNLLNLYNFWFTPRIEPIVAIMSAGDRLLPRILGFVNFLLYARFYHLFLQKNKLTVYNQK